MNKVLVKGMGNSRGAVEEIADKKLAYNINYLEELFAKYNSVNHIYGSRKSIEEVRDEIDNFIIDFSCEFRRDQAVYLIDSMEMYLSDDNLELKDYAIYRMGFMALRGMYNCGANGNDKVARLITNGMYIFSMLNEEDERFENCLGNDVDTYLNEFMECSADERGKILCTLDWWMGKERSEATVYLLSGLCQDVLRDKFVNENSKAVGQK